MASTRRPETRSGPIRVGLHVLGIGTGSKPEIMTAVARAADRHGFATLWCGEHVVMVETPASRYPYSADGKIAVPADADWLDPLLGLSFLAAVTSRIRLATGILLLPEHNPLLVAKQAATLDVLSAGRFILGVGIGWSADEFNALGIAFARRAERTHEYVNAIRHVWAEDVASFAGEFVKFDAVRVYPKPVRDRKVPVVIGGTSEAALERVAAFGDGWYGFNLPTAAAGERIGLLAEHCRRQGRDVRGLHLAVSLSDGSPGDLPELAAAGVTELVIVAEPPAEPQAATDWVAHLADRWLTSPGR